jgi:hypothetical protein
MVGQDSRMVQEWADAQLDTTTQVDPQEADEFW